MSTETNMLPAIPFEQCSFPERCELFCRNAQDQPIDPDDPLSGSFECGCGMGHDIEFDDALYHYGGEHWREGCLEEPALREVAKERAARQAAEARVAELEAQLRATSAMMDELIGALTFLANALESRMVMSPRGVLVYVPEGIKRARAAIARASGGEG